MKKIKVAFFADCLIEDYDGAIRTMYQIVDRIPMDSFEFLFVTGDPPKDSFAHKLIVVPRMPVPMNSNYKMALPMVGIRDLNKKLNQFAPDVIHVATPSPLGNFALGYAERHNRPVISIYHTHFLSYVDYYFRFMPSLIRIAQRVLISNMRSFYNRCDLVYVPTVQMMKELRSIGVFSNHLHLWQRGLPEGLFTPAKRDLSYIRSITHNTLPNVLFSSRLVWEKNLKTLIRIYQAAHIRGLKYNFIVAGSGHAQSALRKAMPHAFFMGHLDHEVLSKLYASADIFLFPSVSETYGNVVIEAMASGLPCVVGDGGGTRDIVRHDQNGWVCAPDDEQAYISGISLLLEDKERRNRYVSAGLKATQYLSWPELAQTYFEDIARLAHNQHLQSA